MMLEDPGETTHETSILFGISQKVNFGGILVSNKKKSEGTQGGFVNLSNLIFE